MQPAVELDEQIFNRIKDDLKKLAPQNADRIFNRSLKRAGTTARAELSRQITSKYTAKSKTVKDDINLKSGKGYAALQVKGHHIDAIDFKVTPTFKIGGPRPKLSVIKSSGGTLSHAFFGIVGTGGHRGIFVQGSKVEEATRRLPYGTNNRTPQIKKALPIREIQGPAVAQMAGTVIDTTTIQDKTLETFLKRVEHELNRELSAGK